MRGRRERTCINTENHCGATSLSRVLGRWGTVAASASSITIIHELESSPKRSSHDDSCEEGDSLLRACEEFLFLTKLGGGVMSLFPLRQHRWLFNLVFGVGAAVAACWTLWVAYQRIMLGDPLPSPSLTEKLLVALWAFGPPVFFWVDWVFFCDGLSAQKLDVAKHTHDLSRNIWLMLVAILAYVVFGKI